MSSPPSMQSKPQIRRFDFYGEHAFMNATQRFASDRAFGAFDTGREFVHCHAWLRAEVTLPAPIGDLWIETRVSTSGRCDRTTSEPTNGEPSRRRLTYGGEN
jgi:hypothetical protein